MRELTGPADVTAVCDDLLLRWAAQALLPGFPGAGRAWAHGDAACVLAPNLNRRDRLVLAGPARDVAVLLDAHGRAPGVKTLLAADRVEEVRRHAPGFAEHAVFGWMERTGSLEPGAGARWVREDELDAVTDLLRVANPGSWTWPREVGARRWAAVFDGGLPVAVAADAWPAPGAGFVGGVATHPGHRGRGLSSLVCAFVVSALLAEHGAVTLMVDGDNATAIRLYSRLGFRYRDVTVLLSDVVPFGREEAAGRAG
ncbi:GNAT family N-acetyltransferase [Umezawaea beigongshangensis]|uniref:GNAT family N-acetyltransferase n=1 Tax=Umezawaea beigongshangensis TaxID=2780383 RepID=UPI0018F19CE6|nr:GNAT family N-acetyltransferase [Umezawaea beigongshangensis]